MGYLAAAGGGLSQDDLVAVSNLSPLAIESALRGLHGRTFSERRMEGLLGERRSVYIFAHETLQHEAFALLGRTISHFQEGIDKWARAVASSGWPTDTSLYLLLGYFFRLMQLEAKDELTLLAIDPKRQARLLELTGSDYAALRQIEGALHLHTGQQTDNLAAMLALASAKEQISLRADLTPPPLCGLWVRLGNREHGEGLAKSIRTRELRAQALASLSLALADIGESERGRMYAEEAAQIRLRDGVPHAAADAPVLYALIRLQEAEVIQSFLAAGRITTQLLTVVPSPEDENLLVLLIQNGYEEVARSAIGAAPLRESPELYCHLAHAFELEADLDRYSVAMAAALDPARGSSSVEARMDELAALAGLALDWRSTATFGEIDAMARSELSSPSALYIRERWALRWLHLAAAMGHTNTLAWCIPLADERFDSVVVSYLRAKASANAGEAALAVHYARQIESSRFKSEALCIIATQLCHAGSIDDTLVILREIDLASVTPGSVLGLGSALLGAGSGDWASICASELRSRWRSEPLSLIPYAVPLVGLWLGVRDLETARSISFGLARIFLREVVYFREKLEILSSLAVAFAMMGDHDHAIALQELVKEPLERVQVKLRVGDALYRLGRTAEARATALHCQQLAQGLDQPDFRVNGLASNCEAFGRAGKPVRGQALIAVAQEIMAVNPGLRERGDLWGELALATAAVSGVAAAAEVARHITQEGSRATILAIVAHEACRQGDLDFAQRTAKQIGFPDAKAEALQHVAEALVSDGRFQEALVLAELPEKPEDRRSVVAAIAVAVARGGDLDRALQVVARLPCSGARARAYAEIGVEAARWHLTGYVDSCLTSAFADMCAGEFSIDWYRSAVAAVNCCIANGSGDLAERIASDVIDGKSKYGSARVYAALCLAIVGREQEFNEEVSGIASERYAIRAKTHARLGDLVVELSRVGLEPLALRMFAQWVLRARGAAELSVWYRVASAVDPLWPVKSVDILDKHVDGLLGVGSDRRSSRVEG